MVFAMVALLAAAAAPKDKVRVTFHSEPDTHVRADWPGGHGKCDTPCHLEVPRNSSVNVEFVLDGQVVWTERVFANKDKTVEGHIRVYADPF